MSVAAWSGTLLDWKSALVDVKACIAPALGRSETRISAGAFIDGLIRTDPATLAVKIDVEDWSCLSAGEGAKGPRLYEWARLPIGFSENNGFERWLSFRRSLRDPKAMASYFVHAPKGTSLADIAGAAGLRWTIEECFLRAKDDLGLDHCEARSWHGWHRHMTLVMAAAAFLAKLAADQRRHAFGKRIDAILEAKAA